MPDGRVLNLWDGSQLSGRQFAFAYGVHLPLAWDVFYLYDEGARWNDQPPSLLATGSTIIAARRELQRALEPWLTRP